MSARIPMVVMVMMALAILVACDRKGVDETLAQARRDNAYTSQTCEPTHPASDRGTRIPDPVKPSSCYAVVMMCNYCDYDAEGAFKKSDEEACGVCVGWETK
jgi:hypothetical protein